MKSLNYFILFILINLVFSIIPEETGITTVDIEELNIDYNETNCKKVIDILVNLVNEIYIYNDITNKPPNETYYGSVNLTKEFLEIPTKDRKYYDFFRDIKRVIAKTKDLHFHLEAKNFTEDGIPINNVIACMPISLYVKGNSPESAEMYIQEFEDCLNFYSQDEKDFIKNFIKAHLNKPIMYINEESPFDFIQNFPVEFLSLKGKHGTFSLMIDYFNLFPLSFIPLSKEELTNIKFTFNDNTDITLNYTLFIQPPEEEKNNAHLTYLNKMSKKLNNRENMKEIIWKYSTKNKSGFQCLVDEDNQVNVFKQSSLELMEDSEEVIKNCSEEFYNNSYPIIGIESQNLGGSGVASALVQQFTQIKILQRHQESIKYSDLTTNLIPKDEMFDVETCEKIKEFKKITDTYGDGIEHHRTQLFQEINSTKLKEWKEIRKKYYKKNHLKKPTQIIIFTDFRAFSATSYLIKGFQETGGAIIVGYRGNPKLKNEPLDASLSPSGLTILQGTEMYQTLNECGFEVTMLTAYESFNYSYQGPNPIPREFIINPVDERVNIYQAYDDSLYEDFIREAKKIFEKYNEGNQCNPDNELLLFEPDNGECYNLKDFPNAHGGYQCDKDKKEWSNICKPFYCDIGYYFDTYQSKCIKDICTEEEKNIGTIIGASFFIYLVNFIILFM